MFQCIEERSRKRWDKNKVRDILNIYSVLDKVACSISLCELIFLKEAFSKHLQNIVLSCLIASSFHRAFTEKELFVCIGVLHWILRRSSIRNEIFVSLAVHSEHAPLGLCLEYIIRYARREIEKVFLSRELMETWSLCAVFLLMFAVVEGFLCRKAFSVNVRRKFFHIGAFVYLGFFPIESVRVHAVVAIFFFAALPRCLSIVKKHLKIEVNEKKIFTLFLSEKDKKKVISHLLLLCGCFFVAEVEKEREKRLFILSSVCIIDTVSSFALDRHNYPKRHKNLAASMKGAVCAAVILSLLDVYYPLWCYTLLGLVEYTAEMNDNIALLVIGHAISYISTDQK